MQPKYFMLTAKAENNSNSNQNNQPITFANIYTDFKKLKDAYFVFKAKQQKKELAINELKTFVLMPVEKGEDLVIANVNGVWHACIGPKQQLKDVKEHVLDNVELVKVAASEIMVKE
ncbi:hypothetical protein J4206_06195 [Candidatus Woesearchaeota archaeon]|nr:hypothetical protein [Candidatus Woesearchaeota archaeon]